MEQNQRRRGGSFHLELESLVEQNLTSVESDPNPVQFMTPHYEGRQSPEPLDLSKICLDEFGDKPAEDDAEEDEEEIYSRGRSRSRSVHEMDANAGSRVVSSDGPQIPNANSNPEQQQKPAEKTERTGPLQHREVLALKKGLEEATQSLNRNQAQGRAEDEEERIAADAEKRKRMLAAANHTNLSSPDGESDAVARRVKILMLGDSGVGKSSLMMRWTQDAFSPTMGSTVGVNFKSKKISVRGEAVQVQVWDTAGQEQFHKITTSYYKGANGIMLMYDISDPKSLENIGYWIKNIKSHASDSVQVALIGNKSDLRGSSAACVEMEKGTAISQKFSIPFYETSAKESINVGKAFQTLVEHIIDYSTPVKGVASVLAGGLGVGGAGHLHGQHATHHHAPPGAGATSGANNSGGAASSSGIGYPPHAHHQNVAIGSGGTGKDAFNAGGQQPQGGPPLVPVGVGRNNSKSRILGNMMPNSRLDGGKGVERDADGKEKCLIS